MEVALEVVRSLIPFNKPLGDYTDEGRNNPFVQGQCAILISHVMAFKVRAACAWIGTRVGILIFHGLPAGSRGGCRKSALVAALVPALPPRPGGHTLWHGSRGC